MDQFGEVFDDETGAIAARKWYLRIQKQVSQILGDCLLRRTMISMNSSLAVSADEHAAQITTKH